jgi:hypothetical protein
LWHCFPSSVDAVAVLDAFRAFAQRDGSRCCPSDDLRENAGWADFLSLISPSLALPEQEVADEIVV